MQVRVPRTLAAGLFWVGTFAALSCDSPTKPTAITRPAALEIISGDDQDGTVGQPLPNPIVARVVDENDQPIQGQIVNFVVVSGGGSVFAGASISNSQGIVQEWWTLGTTAGVEQQLEARAVDNETGERLVFATFTATGTPDAADRLIKLAGDGTGTAGEPVSPRPSVRVEDQYGNSVPGATVTFAATSGGGTVTGGQVNSDANGVATVGDWTLGPASGAQTLTASTPGADAVSFTVVAGAANPAALVFVTPPPATARSAQSLPTIVVGLRDEFGNTVAQPNVPVTIAVVGEGRLNGTLTINTNAEGQATFGNLMLGGPTGPNALRFTAPGFSPLTHAIEIQPGQPTGLQRAVANPQEVVAGGTVPLAPAVRVLDGMGFGVRDVQVTFVITSGGGALTGATPVSDANGLAATESWTVGTTAGQATVRASIPFNLPVTFNATVHPAGPASLTPFGPSSAQAGSNVTPPPGVTVRDQYGNDVPGVTVTFAVASGGGSITGPTQVTDAEGVARVGSWTLGGALGTQTLSASLGDLSATISVTATSGSGYQLVKHSGDGQPGAVGELLFSPLVVRVLDQFGNPRQGVEVEWRVMPNGGTVSGNLNCVSPQRPCLPDRAYGITNSQGQASATWRLSTAGPVPELEARVRATDPPPPVVFTANVTPMMIAAFADAGANHSCAVGSAAVYCWGLNGRRQLGDGTTLTRYRPEKVLGIPYLVQVSAGYQDTCGLTQDGVLWCWGADVGAQQVNTPLRFETLDGYGNLRCALTESGEAWCWVPGGALVRMQTDARFSKIDVAENHTCALTFDGQVYCWGDNAYGRLGDGTEGGARYETPLPIASSAGYRDIAAGGFHSCAVTLAGTVDCWGRNPATGAVNATPTRVTGLSGAVDIAVGYWHSCAITSTGDMYCWGKDTEGQLGDGGTTGSSATPLLVEGGGNWRSVSGGGAHTCGITQNSGLLCWGFAERTGTGQSAGLMLQPNFVLSPRVP